MQNKLFFRHLWASTLITEEAAADNFSTRPFSPSSSLSGNVISVPQPASKKHNPPSGSVMQVA
jgi:hypothetical protein